MRNVLIIVSISVTFYVQGQAVTDSMHMQPILREIKGRQIIGLGESGHGYESVNKAKAAFATVLHQQMHINAISFESSFTQSITGYLSGIKPDMRARQFLYPFWNTTSVNKALNPFFQEEELAGIPLITGFDIQEDCRFQNFSKLLIKHGFVTVNKLLLYQADSILSFYLGKDHNRTQRLTPTEYNRLTELYKVAEQEVSSNEHAPFLNKLLVRCIQNRLWLCRYLTLATTGEKMYYRDSLMAENILWLSKEVYAGKPMIIWGADTHIAKLKRDQHPAWTGEWLSTRLGEGYLSLSFQKGKAVQPFPIDQTSFRLFAGSSYPFDLVIYLDQLTKIAPEEWITPCDQ